MAYFLAVQRKITASTSFSCQNIRYLSNRKSNPAVKRKKGKGMVLDLAPLTGAQ